MSQWKARVIGMEVLTWVLVTLASIALVSIVTTFVVVRMVYKRIRRSRALSSAALRTQVRLTWGPRREVVKLRMRLQDSLDSGQAAVDLALRSAGPRGELPRLFRRIRSEGDTLEAQLRLMSSERDPVLLAKEIPVATRRVDQVAGLVSHLRSAVAAGLGDLSDDTLQTLRSEVDHEVSALHAGVQELRALNGNGSPDPGPQLSIDGLNRGNQS